MAGFRTLEDLEVSGRTVLVRLELNVPMKDGKVTRGAKARLVRDGTIVYDGTIESLRRGAEDVREVASGFECGIVLHNYADVKQGDVIEVYDTKQVERQLT